MGWRGAHLAGGIPDLKLDPLAIELDGLPEERPAGEACGSGLQSSGRRWAGRTLILKSMPMVARTLSLKSSSA